MLRPPLPSACDTVGPELVGPELETVELDANGVVVFRNKSGAPVMWMPLSIYEAYLSLAGKESPFRA